MQNKFSLSTPCEMHRRLYGVLVFSSSLCLLLCLGCKGKSTFYDFSFPPRNAIKLFQVEVSLSMKADLIVRCTIMPAEARCASVVKSQSQADASLPCTVNFTLSTLCVHFASNSSTKVLLRNRMTSHTVIHALSNFLGR